MTRQRGWPAGGALAIVVTLLLAACGGGEGIDSATADGGTTAGATGRVSTPSDTPSAATDEGATDEAVPSPTRTAREQTPAEEDEAFAYVPWGPDDPPVPQRYASLAATSSTAARCDDSQANAIPSAFWDLAVGVCRAVVGAGPWPSTTSVPAPPPPKNAYEACLDAELAAMLQRALRWRAAHPHASVPQVRYPARGALSPCQTRIFETRVLADGESPFAIPTGQVAVLVFAGSADVASTLTVDGRPAEVLDVEPASGAATLIVLVPAPAQAKTVPVAVTTTRGVLTSTVALPAANLSTSTTAPPTSGTPTGGTSTGTGTRSSSPSGTGTSTPSGSPAGSASP
jgi:hypothetical protein